jgi:hypothetical protein
MAGGSYLSQSDLRAHFGIGPARLADTVEVFWPSGLRQAFRNVEADQFYVIQEGKEQLMLQKFRRPAALDSRGISVPAQRHERPTFDPEGDR